MRQKSGPEGSAEKYVKKIRRKTGRKFSAEEKIRIVLEDLRGAGRVLSSTRISKPTADLYRAARAIFLLARMVHSRSARLDSFPVPRILKGLTPQAPHPVLTYRRTANEPAILFPQNVPFLPKIDDSRPGPERSRPAPPARCLAQCTRHSAHSGLFC
ncbi:MAG: hypothetical protein CBB65_13950 [Hyphomonadaceae bacterium TMED5]|nr:hypothetical protein [Ponticaulis sp.]OUX97496.1 MAG: hypothetical protein CBB65_13950 [Hyphomonadaceae bacterium TMED5]